MKTAAFVQDGELELRREYLAGRGVALEDRIGHLQQELKCVLSELGRVKSEWDLLDRAIKRREAQPP